MKAILVRFGEISLKRGKRKYFLKKLIANICKKIDCDRSRLRVIDGRIIIEGEASLEKISKTPGVVSISLADVIEENEIYEYLDRFAAVNPSSFRVSVQRVDKSYPKTSLQIAREVGEIIRKKFNWRVDLKNPELNIFIEIIDGKFYIFDSKIRGVGGLPVGTQGKLVTLLSGGIDSSVASYLMMRRGAELIALHFSSEGENNIKRIVEKLSEIHDLDLIIERHDALLDPFLGKLKRKEWTCVVCKFLMLKRASEIAREVGALGIVTGDSLGQVASQTLDNLYIESMATDMPIYRPLIGLDKVEIENIARFIGTFELSVNRPCPFAPRRVITQGRSEEFISIAREIGLI